MSPCPTTPEAKALLSWTTCPFALCRRTSPLLSLFSQIPGGNLSPLLVTPSPPPCPDVSFSVLSLNQTSLSASPSQTLLIPVSFSLLLMCPHLTSPTFSQVLLFSLKALTYHLLVQFPLFTWPPLYVLFLGRFIIREGETRIHP